MGTQGENVALGAKLGSLWVWRLRSELENCQADSVAPFCVNMFKFRLIINQGNVERENTDCAFQASLTSSKNVFWKKQNQPPPPKKNQTNKRKKQKQGGTTRTSFILYLCQTHRMYTTKGNPNVNSGFRRIMMCQCRVHWL